MYTEIHGSSGPGPRTAVTFHRILNIGSYFLSNDPNVSSLVGKQFIIPFRQVQNQAILHLNTRLH